MVQLTEQERKAQMESMKAFDKQMPCVGIFWYDAGGISGNPDECALLTGLQKYARDEGRKRGALPKFLVYSNALLTTYRGLGFITDRTDTRVLGRWVESDVAPAEYGGRTGL